MRGSLTFSAYDSSFEYFEHIKGRVLEEIRGISEAEILSINPEEFAENLAKAHYMSPAILTVEGIEVSDKEEDVSRDHFPAALGFSVMGPTVRTTVYTYHIPFTPGDAQYPSFIRPGTSVRSKIFSNNIELTYIDRYKDRKRVESEFEKDLELVKNAFSSLTSHYNRFNAGLKAICLKQIDVCRNNASKRAENRAASKYPIRESTSLPQNISTPPPKMREKIILQQNLQTGLYQRSDPVQDYETYQKILKTIDDVGRCFETLPSTSEGKGEEALRDHILSFIIPSLKDGVATAESFNRTGKTDILIQYNNNPVFIAECKFWDGIEVLYKTIDQLLSYLVYRNTKTAIILFVDKMDFLAVMSKIKAKISGHPGHDRLVKEIAPNWLELDFHLPEAPDCKLTLTVQAFHIPPKTVKSGQ
jgi:hypothetical protein